MPTVLRSGPYRLFFFSNEGDEPRHVHIQAAEKYAKYWISPVTLARNIGFNPSELTRIRGLVEEHEALIEEKWNEHFQSSA